MTQKIMIKMKLAMLILPKSRQKNLSKRLIYMAFSAGKNHMREKILMTEKVWIFVLNSRTVLFMKHIVMKNFP